MFSLQISIAIIFDWLLGDPSWFPHPVRFIGKGIQIAERLTRWLVKTQLVAGFITVAIVLVGTIGTVTALLYGLSEVDALLRDCFAIAILYMGIACKDLMTHADRVYELLVKEAPLADARNALGMIVGRDTSSLEEDDICRATVETVAENMVDGITAPLFWAIIGSLLADSLGLSPICWAAVGCFTYKAINTMDSMIGYKNERYILFGRPAARFDDAVNFLPARLSGICVIIAAFFLKFDYRRAAVVFALDRLRHSSPNAGHTEAAVAGALGLRLGGTSCYNGVVVEKEYIGTVENCPSPEDIKHTEKLVLVGSAIFLAAILALRSAVV